MVQIPLGRSHKRDKFVVELGLSVARLSGFAPDYVLFLPAGICLNRPWIQRFGCMLWYNQFWGVFSWRPSIQSPSHASIALCHLPHGHQQETSTGDIAKPSHRQRSLGRWHGGKSKRSSYCFDWEGSGTVCSLGLVAKRCYNVPYRYLSLVRRGH